MPVIQLKTNIQAPIERVFDLCRSVEVHVRSTPQTQERVVGGVMSGLLDLNDTVTWEATHLGIRQRLTSCITICNPPFFFQDKMVSGAFESFTHNHSFGAVQGRTVVEDHFDFESPCGLIGVIFNQILLTEYMRHFLKTRLSIVKQIAESDEWRMYLNGTVDPDKQ